MNIVLCLNHFMPQQVAGTEVYTWALAKALIKKGHRVTIVVPNYDTDVNDEYVYEDLCIKRYAEPNHIDTRLRSGQRPPDGIESFKQLIADIGPDVVHVQELAGSSGIGIFHLRVLKMMNVKIIFTMHLANYSCFCGTLMYRGKEHCDGMIDISRCTKCALSKLQIGELSQQLLYNASMPLYTLGINTGKMNNAVGTAFSYPFVIKNLQKRLFEITEICLKIIILTDWYKTVLLKNGVPENKISLIKQALPYAAEAPNVTRSETQASTDLRLIFIGRIDPLKGLHLLLKAMESIPEYAISLDIFGIANDNNYYESWKAETKSKKNIKWRGAMPQKEVVSTLAAYDALVLPSTFSEMSPLVIQEAFAAGVPVIGANVAGIAEQIKDGYNGLLFDFNNSSALNQILSNIVSNTSLLAAMRRNILPPSDFDSVVEQTLAVYNA